MYKKSVDCRTKNLEYKSRYTIRQQHVQLKCVVNDVTMTSESRGATCQQRKKPFDGGTGGEDVAGRCQDCPQPTEALTSIATIYGYYDEVYSPLWLTLLTLPGAYSGFQVGGRVE